MRKISIWGKNNPRKARMIIAVSYLLLVVIGIMLGLLGYMKNIRVSSAIMTGIILSFFILYLFYPIRHTQWKLFRHSYVRQKSHDFLLAFCTLLLIGGLTNQFAFEPIVLEERQPMVRPVVFKQQENKKLDSPLTMYSKKSLRESLKLQVKNIKYQLKEWKKNNGDEKPNKGLGYLQFFLFLLTLGVGILALAGVLALSCNLSCSGNEGAAVLVAIGGLALVVFFGVLAIRGIVRMGKKKASE